MSNDLHDSSIFLFILVLFLTVEIKSQPKAVNKHSSIHNISGSISYKKFNINNISTYVYNNGFIDIDPDFSKGGFVFTKGSGKTAVYQSGFLWGGKINGEVRVSGSAYVSGLVPGKIQNNGTPENPDNPTVRIYRVRRDYKTSNLQSEINDEEGTYQQIFNNYQKDWNEWPAAEGAPFQDVDGDSVYNPSIDIPGVPGADQTIWYVANDLNEDQTKKFSGSLPTGIELQVTIWGYNISGFLNNTNFRKYKLINKSSNEIKDMYLAQWSDINDGGANDELAACDTVRNLGYEYNASDLDGNFGSTPPAVGFDLVQGPIADGDENDIVLINGKIIIGKKILPMTAFVRFAGGDSVFSMPIENDYKNGALAWYNFFQGRYGINGSKFTFPKELGGDTTSFAFSGDPLSGNGWLDDIKQLQGEKSILLCSGPIDMAPGDTQEVVIANVIGAGIDRINAIRILNFYDVQVQNAYNSLSDIVVPKMPAPKLIASYSGNSINLSWGASPDSLKTIEEFYKDKFFFEGYNVYQLYSDLPLKENSKFVAEYDLNDQLKEIKGQVMNRFTGLPEIGTIYNGTDSGIKRNITLSKDIINNEPFIKGKRYYFMVGAYAYNECGCSYANTTESLSNMVPVDFQSTFPGYNYGDTVKVIHTSGISDAVINPVVVNPSLLTGHSYNITFNESGNTVTWNLIDSTTGKTLLSNQEDFSVNDNAPFVDGMKLIIKNVNQNALKSWEIPKGTRRFSWVNADFGFNGFNGAVGWASPYYYFGPGKEEVVPVTQLKRVLIKLARVVDSTKNYDPMFDPNDPNMSYGYRYGTRFDQTPARLEFVKHIINKTGGFAYQDFGKNIPLSVWDVDDPANPVRLAVGFLENNGNAGLVDGKYWPGSNSFYSNIDTNGPREWLFIFNSVYNETPNPEYQVDIAANPIPVMWWFTVTRNGNVPFSPGSTGEDQFLIIPSNPLTGQDFYSFLTEQDTSWRKWYFPDKFQLYQNYPNPFNPVTKIRFSLKQKEMVKLDVYNLLGQKVIELINQEKDIGTYEAEFDGSKFASGIYFYRMQAGDNSSVKKMILLK